MIRNLFGGTSKCRTIDKVDIFGDSSGVALYQLDGNANDTGGNYHGTEVAGVTYGGGAYERGVIVTSGKIDLGAGSKALMPSTADYSISAWIYNSGVASRRIIATRTNAAVGTGYGDAFYYESDNTLRFQKIFGSVGGNQEELIYTPSYTVGWHHVVVSFARGANIANIYSDGVLVATKSNWNTGTYDNNLNVLIGAFHNTNYNAYQDQTRFFNRAITATEVATLYAECAPTSTVDNINPFMDGSLKALYKFNGDATDATGVYNGTATNVTYGTGKFGQCGVFNGTSSFIDFTKVPSTNAISFWMKEPITTSATTGRLFSDSLSAYNTTNPTIAIQTGDATSFVTGETLSIMWHNGTTVYLNYITTVFNDTNWKHIVMQWNGSGYVIYVNGISQTVLVYGTATYMLDKINRIGRVTTYYSALNIDQVRIFNKALTPMEVASLYNETTPLEEPMYKLVDPFRDGSGKALYRLEGNALDESGNYNGTATSVTYGAGQFGRCGIFSTSKIATTATIGANTSISFWAYRTSTGDSAINGNSGTQYILSNLSVWLSNGSNCFSASTVMLPVTSTWYHIVIVDNGSSVKAYRNGVEVTNLTGTYNAITQTLSNIGTYAPLATHNFGGYLEQIRIFNRALTAGEVSKLYTGENNVL